MLSDSRGSAHTQIRGWVFTEFTGFSDTCTEVVCLVHQPWSAARQTRLLDVAGLLIFHLFIPTDSQKHFLKIWHCSWTWEPSKKPIKGFTVFFTKCAQKNPVSKQRLQSLLDVCRPLKHWTSLELNLSTAERLMKLLAKQNGPLLARLERVQVGLVVSVFGLWRFLTQQRQKPCLCRYILEKLHTDSGQMLSRDKDPKEPTRITGCNKGFFTSQLVGL